MKNEICIFSILGQNSYPANATTQSDSVLLMMPAKSLRSCVDQNSALREHIFLSLSQRFNDILATIDQVIFQRMDNRIAQFILHHLPPENSSLKMTHEHISHELGTNRVVVSRILEAFEKEGMVSLNRGIINVRDKVRLAAK